MAEPPAKHTRHEEEEPHADAGPYMDLVALFHHHDLGPLIQARFNTNDKRALRLVSSHARGSVDSAIRVVRAPCSAPIRAQPTALLQHFALSWINVRQLNLTDSAFEPGDAASNIAEDAALSAALCRALAIAPGIEMLHLPPRATFSSVVRWPGA